MAKNVKTVRETVNVLYLNATHLTDQLTNPQSTGVKVTKYVYTAQNDQRGRVCQHKRMIKDKTSSHFWLKEDVSELFHLIIWPLSSSPLLLFTLHFTQRDPTGVFFFYAE